MSDQSSAREHRVGDFRIIREVGRGGFGTVYEAVQDRLNRLVALKVYHTAFALDGDERRIFEREARIAARVEHRHILPIYRIGEADGIPFIAMEYVEGCSLDQIIEELQKTPIEQIRRSTFLKAVKSRLTGTPLVEACNDPEVSTSDDPNHAETAALIVCHAARALASAHQKNVIHRDLKPANLLLRKDGHLFISDFGMARDSTLATLTATGQFQGTVNYLSPEQTLAERKAVDHRTDIYSLGATLYEMLTLKPPVNGHSTTEIVQNIVFKRSPRVSHVNTRIPRDLTVVVERAMEKDPDDRYPSMEEFADDLQRFLDHKAVAARPIGRVGRAWRFCANHAYLTTTVCLTLAAVLTLGSWMFYELAAFLSARKAEIRVKEGRLARNLGAIESLADREDYAEALRRLGLLRAEHPDGSRIEATFKSVQTAAVEAINSSLGTIEKPLGKASLEDTLAAIRRLDELQTAVPANEHLDAVRLDKGTRRCRQIEAALQYDSSVANLFPADDAEIRRTLTTLLYRVSDDRRKATLRFHINGQVHDLEPQSDYNAALARSGEVPLSRVVFGGYCIQCNDNSFQDLATVNAIGAAVLCLRHCPDYGDINGAFGSQEHQQQHAALISKAQVAQRAGARALFVVNRESGADKPTAHASAVPSFVHIPVFLISRTAADALLATSGRTLSGLQREIDKHLKPVAFEIPNTQISISTPSTGNGSRSPEVLLPLLKELCEDGDTLAIDLAALILGQESCELLSRILQSGSPRDVGQVAIHLYEHPRQGMGELLKQVLEHWATESVPGASRMYAPYELKTRLPDDSGIDDLSSHVWWEDMRWGGGCERG